ncbi:hypothetical protein PROFUN_03772 [Planoprotostelium fungivorum]|uniref:Uncharacterized protein n=1 Tax=Planoprotostelium fungivorum TaxID=1890364 RepID=A0A2P6NDT7_9EUKA|nr:hypothetical protein PROFUN_03772 [Planoprotostelium fungivorum]
MQQWTFIEEEDISNVTIFVDPPFETVQKESHLLALPHDGCPLSGIISEGTHVVTVLPLFQRYDRTTFYLYILCTLSTVQGPMRDVIFRSRFSPTQGDEPSSPDSDLVWTPGFLLQQDGDKSSILGSIRDPKKLAAIWPGFISTRDVTRLSGAYQECILGSRVMHEAADRLEKNEMSPSELSAMSPDILSSLLPLAIDLGCSVKLLRVIAQTTSTEKLNLQPALFSAVCAKREEVVHWLTTECGVDPTADDGFIIFCASYLDDQSVVKLLLSCGCRARSILPWVIRVESTLRRELPVPLRLTSSLDGPTSITLRTSTTSHIDSPASPETTPDREEDENHGHFRFYSAPVKPHQRASYEHTPRRMYLIDGTKDVIIGNRMGCQLCFSSVLVLIDIPPCLEGPTKLQMPLDQTSPAAFKLPALTYRMRPSFWGKDVRIVFRIFADVMDPITGEITMIHEELPTHPFSVCSNPARLKAKNNRKMIEPSAFCGGCILDHRGIASPPCDSYQ